MARFWIRNAIVGVILLCSVVTVFDDSYASQSSIPGGLILSLDPLGYCCGIPLPSQGTIVTIHVVHVLTTDVSGVRFSAPKPECFGATFISDSHPFSLTTGDSQTQVTVDYGYCHPGAVINVLSMNYLITSPTSACCLYAPQSVEVFDCSGGAVAALGDLEALNPGPGCSGGCDNPCGTPLPTEATTWGAVKSLYTQ